MTAYVLPPISLKVILVCVYVPSMTANCFLEACYNDPAHDLYPVFEHNAGGADICCEFLL